VSPSALPTGDPAPADGLLPTAALLDAPEVPFGVYVHVPFCTTRCGYCDFNTYTSAELGGGASQAGYADVVLSEIRLARHVLRGRVPAASTVFFGGGTPTVLPAEHLGVILLELEEAFGFTADVEITTEANPETVTPGYLDSLRRHGFSRISIGMQSAVPKVLEVLDRRHRPGRPEEAVAEARVAGFEHVNLDLIYGAPYETDADWEESVWTAINTGVDHVSAYALVVEDGTALARQVASGVLPPPDDDVLADRYVLADDLLTRAGYDWYEVSNWARSDKDRCRHNELYWQGANWWGFGPGAHSHISGVRWWNVKHPGRYAVMLSSGRSPAVGREVLDQPARELESIMLGIRLREGFPVELLSSWAVDKAAAQVRWGLLDQRAWSTGRVALTQRGRLMADAVVRDLVP
jgi:oxygen-independent coproporphyrinogen-3 oxidase